MSRDRMPNGFRVSLDGTMTTVRCQHCPAGTVARDVSLLTRWANRHRYNPQYQCEVWRSVINNEPEQL